MGHDITAYDTDTGKEVGYLRRGAGNPLARVIYIALDAQSADGGCSGDGSWRTVSIEQLSSALKFLLENEDDLRNIGGRTPVFDSLLSSLKASGCHIETPLPRNCLDQEVSFLHECIWHCESNEGSSVRIQFA